MTAVFPLYEFLCARCRRSCETVLLRNVKINGLFKCIVGQTDCQRVSFCLPSADDFPLRRRDIAFKFRIQSQRTSLSIQLKNNTQVNCAVDKNTFRGIIILIIINSFLALIHRFVDPNFVLSSPSRIF